MKKAASLLVLLPFSLFAFHNLAIAPDSARIGIDTMTMTGSYEHVGDTLTIVKYFQDVNNNGVYDAGTDIDELQGQTIQIIDGVKGSGDKAPDDTIADGLFNLKIETGGDGSFGIPGKFYFIIASGGIADTAGFKLLLTKTNTFISGTVTDPSGVGIKNLFIDARFAEPSTNNNLKNANAVTDSQGVYVFYVDSTFRNKRVQVQIQDNTSSSIQPSWIMPSQIDTLLIDSLKNMNFAFAAASHFVKGLAQDEHGNALKNVPLYLQKDSSNTSVNFIADSLGLFLVGVLPGRYGIYMQTWNFPGYLMNNSPDKTNIIVSNTTDTVHVTYVAHSTDTVISGTIKDDSLVLKNKSLSVQVSGNIKDTMYSSSIDVQSAGAYKIKVSSAIDTYTVRFYVNNLPNKFYVYPSGYRVHFGADSCKASILKGAAQISGVVQDSLNNPVNYSQVLIADTALQIYFALSTDNGGKFSQTVPAGNYVIAFSGNSQAMSNQINGTVGPVVITASSNDTFVTCIGKPVSVATQAPGNGRVPRSFAFSASNISRSTVFSFVTPLAGKARIMLFDVKGRMLGTIMDRFISPGSYHIRWDLQSRLLIAGQPYVIKFDFFGSQKFSTIAKIILLK